MLTLPDWLGGFHLFDGITFDQMSALFALSFTFLGLVCINGLFKYRINVMKGRMGERLLRRLRYELVDRVLRFFPARLRRTKPAEVASMVKDEVEPLGGFVGEAFATPAYLGGQALTAVVFILLQNVLLGMVAVGVVSIDRDFEDHGARSYRVHRRRRPRRCACGNDAALYRSPAARR